MQEQVKNVQIWQTEIISDLVKEVLMAEAKFRLYHDTSTRKTEMAKCSPFSPITLKGSLHL
jgi:hypothetical protein